MKVIQSICEEPCWIYSFPHKKNDCLFFDIETTGLSPKTASIYLIGTIFFDSQTNQWTMTQWFADDYKSEETIIHSFLEQLEHFSNLYHFNGQTFDLPFIMHKCEKYEITISEHNKGFFCKNCNDYETSSIDLLTRIRKLKKLLNITKANQKSLEQFLGFTRTDEKSGGELISVYSEYMQAKILRKKEAVQLEHLLLLHNHDDILCMLPVSSLLNYALLLHAPEKHITNIQMKQNDSPYAEKTASPSITFSFQYDILLPKEITYAFSYPKSKALPEQELYGSLTLSKQSGKLTVPIFHGTLKYFFHNYKDYYYLPIEDTAIHKSLAEFVDSSYRKKATAATCYVRSENDFIPSLNELNGDTDYKTFYACHHDKLPFYALSQNEESAAKSFYTDYLLSQLSSILCK